MGVKEDPHGTGYTTYVVLWFVETGWEVLSAEVVAKSADAAIRNVVDHGGVFVAVPARSWKPMRVEQVQTVQTVITPTAADEDPTKASNSKNAPESEIRAVEAEAEES